MFLLSHRRMNPARLERRRDAAKSARRCHHQGVTMIIHATPKRSATMPKQRGEEGLRQRHLHLPAVGERGEHALGLGLVRRRQRQRKTLEARFSLAVTVGGHHHGLADAEVRMQHLVFGARREHAGWRGLGALLVTYERRHLRAERLAVELERFLATAVKEQIGFDSHDVSLVTGPGYFFPSMPISRNRSSVSLGPNSSSSYSRRTSISASLPSPAGLGKRLVHSSASSGDFT